MLLLVLAVLAVVLVVRRGYTEGVEARLVSELEAGKLDALWFTADGRLAGAWRDRGILAVRLWSVASGRAEWQQDLDLSRLVDPARIVAFSVSPDASRVAWATAGSVKGFYLAGASAGRTLEFELEPGRAVLFLAFTEAGQEALVYRGGRLELRDFDSGVVLAQYETGLAEPGPPVVTGPFIAVANVPTAEAFAFDTRGKNRLSLVEYKQYPKGLGGWGVSDAGRLVAATEHGVVSATEVYTAPGAVRAIATAGSNVLLVGGEFEGLYLLLAGQRPVQVAKTLSGGTRRVAANATHFALAGETGATLFTHGLARHFSPPSRVHPALLAAALGILVGLVVATFWWRAVRGKARPAEPEEPIGQPAAGLAAPSELIEALKTGECVLYAGSGLSAQAGMPTWSQFLESLAKVAVENGLASQSGMSFILAGLRGGNARGAMKALAEAFEEREALLFDGLRRAWMTDAPLSAVHRLIQQTGFAGIVTTNPDDLLERAFPEARVLTATTADRLRAALDRREFFLAKPYGTLRLAEEFLFGPAKFNQAVFGNYSLTAAFEDLFTSRTLLFIGASLEGIEDDLRNFAFERSLPLRHFALAPNAAGNPRARELERRYGIQTLSYTPSADTHPEVARFLEKLAAAAPKAVLETHA